MNRYLPDSTSCPLFHKRYVYVYGATPNLVYFGHTSGYLDTYAAVGQPVMLTTRIFRLRCSSPTAVFHILRPPVNQLGRQHWPRGQKL